MDPALPGPSSQRPPPSVDEDSDNDNIDRTHNVDLIQAIVNDDSDDPDGEEISEDELPIGTVYNPVWSISTVGMRPITFVRQPGLLVPLPGERKPYDYFRMLFDDIFIENIIKFSNKHAFEVLAKPDLTPKSRINKWKDLTAPEFLKFVGLTLHTGTIRLNRVQDYWKKDSLFNLPLFRQVMPRDRYMNIMRCLYSRNPNHPETSSLDKVKYIVDHFNNTMQQIYYPEKELSLDEAMVLWRGRLYFRQYIKGKRHKYGVKLYSLTESTGLILKFHVYGGEYDTLVGGVGHTEKIVLHLLREKLNNGHSVFMDNFYNGFPLASKLLANQTYCTGTIQLGRLHLPADVVTAKLKKGETIARYAEGVMIGKWKDKRVVTYLSTEYENEMVEFNTRRGTVVNKPLPIIHYNAYMSGVDRADQLLSYYPCERKTLRWYKKIVIHVIQMMLLNAHNLYNKYETKMSFYDFRLAVIRSLLPPLDNPIESPAQKRLRLGVHEITKHTERDVHNRIKRKNCRVCCRTKKNKLTPYFCNTCADKPGLCLGECFNTYHNE